MATLPSPGTTGAVSTTSGADPLGSSTVDSDDGFDDVDDASPVGQECMVEGSGVRGIDDCEAGAVCFGVDPLTNLGVCVAQCQGSVQEPLCDTGQCGFLIEVLHLCADACNPLAFDCPESSACTAAMDDLMCLPASGSAEQAGPFRPDRLGAWVRVHSQPDQRL